MQTMEALSTFEAIHVFALPYEKSEVSFKRIYFPAKNIPYLATVLTERTSIT